MELLQNLNERKNRLCVWDIGLIKWSVFYGAIVIVKLILAIVTVYQHSIVIHSFESNL